MKPFNVQIAASPRTTRVNVRTYKTVAGFRSRTTPTENNNHRNRETTTTTTPAAAAATAAAAAVTL
jgi:hypothetical protein